MIEPGRKAPAFALKDQDGTTHKLTDYAGRPVILYFYPKDDTPGCTAEACAFRDSLRRFQTSKAQVLGVSILDEQSKARFAGKYSLNFPLLADADHAVAEKYGVWQEKSRYGRTYMGIIRSHFVIDEEGRLADVRVKISPEDSVAAAVSAVAAQASIAKGEALAQP